MIFELTISGLFVVVLKSTEKRPVHPDAVDVICPRDAMHRARLCYSPDRFRPTRDEPTLTVDTMGRRIASMDLADTFLEVAVNPNPYPAFTVGWGPENAVQPPATEWMNWVPTLAELGFNGVTLGTPGQIPAGANTRLTLPKGEIFCRNIVRHPDTSKFLIWQFPAAANRKRVVANEIVYRASGIAEVHVRNRVGEVILSSTRSYDDDVLRMSFCNDLSIVKQTYYNNVESLVHLAHIAALTTLKDPPFRPPTLVPNLGQRTESPICNGILHVDGYTGDGRRS